jgi:hypothetical protein
VCLRPLLIHCELAIARVLQLILIACSRNVITEMRSVRQRAGGSRSGKYGSAIDGYRALRAAGGTR